MEIDVYTLTERQRERTYKALGLYGDQLEKQIKKEEELGAHADELRGFLQDLTGDDASLGLFYVFSPAATREQLDRSREARQREAEAEAKKRQEASSQMGIFERSMKRRE